MERYLLDEEIRDLLIKIKYGSEEAWERLYENFEIISMNAHEAFKKILFV